MYYPPVISNVKVVYKLKIEEDIWLLYIKWLNDLLKGKNNIEKVSKKQSRHCSMFNIYWAERSGIPSMHKKSMTDFRYLYMFAKNRLRIDWWSCLGGHIWTFLWIRPSWFNLLYTFSGFYKSFQYFCIAVEQNIFTSKQKEYNLF